MEFFEQGEFENPSLLLQLFCIAKCKQATIHPRTPNKTSSSVGLRHNTFPLTVNSAYCEQISLSLGVHTKRIPL